MSTALRSIRVGSAVLVVAEDGVLLGRRGKEPNFGRWILPGGKIEPLESIDDAAVREVWEETSLEIAVVRRLGVHEILEPPDEHRLIVFSEARVIGGRVRAGSDLLEARFFQRNELADLDITPVVRSVLEAAGWLDPTSLAAALRVG